MTEEQDDERQAKADQLWDMLFRAVFDVRDHDWPTQGETLLKISRLARELADVIEGWERG